MVERGKLGLAAQCLEHAAALAPHQDYVHRHLAIVKARISRLPPEQRDTEVFDDSFWQVGPKERNFNMGDISSSGAGSTAAANGPGNMGNSGSQFLGQTDSVFSNHHSHIGHKKSNTDSLNDHIMHLKGPSKSPRITPLNEVKVDVQEVYNDNDRPLKTDTSSKGMNADATELTIDRERAGKTINSDESKRIISSGKKNAGTTRQTKDTALS